MGNKKNIWLFSECTYVRTLHLNGKHIYDICRHTAHSYIVDIEFLFVKTISIFVLLRTFSKLTRITVPTKVSTLFFCTIFINNSWLWIIFLYMFLNLNKYQLLIIVCFWWIVRVVYRNKLSFLNFFRLDTSRLYINEKNGIQDLENNMKKNKHIIIFCTYICL